MPDFYDPLVWFPILTFLVSIPALCYWDLKYREIPDKYFYAVMIVNFPVMLYQYSVETFTWGTALVAVAMVVMLFLLTKYATDYFHGDDMMILALIALFCGVTPYHPDNGSLGMITLIFLIPVLFLFIGLNGLYNMAFNRDEITGDEMSFIDAMQHCDRGFPMMLPISAAFILAVFL